MADDPIAALFASDGTADRAVAGGFAADRLGYAFAAGYQQALRALIPSLAEGVKASLCATEEQGAHPRAIATSLRESTDGTWRLDGRKRWSTGAPLADVLFVVASIGWASRGSAPPPQPAEPSGAPRSTTSIGLEPASGQNRLRVCRVPARAPGVTITAMPPTPFAPEIPHAEVVFAAVAVAPADLLPGDGYDAYLKPFRTIEDAHVHAAVLGYLLRVARAHAWPQPLQERMCALILAVRGVTAGDPAAATTHVALAGVLAMAQALLADAREHWALVDAETRARWERDAPLLSIASRVREARRDAAWRRL